MENILQGIGLVVLCVVIGSLGAVALALIMSFYETKKISIENKTKIAIQLISFIALLLMGWIFLGNFSEFVKDFKYKDFSPNYSASIHFDGKEGKKNSENEHDWTSFFIGRR